MKRQRLDLLLVARGFTDSESKARALIMAGEVLINGQKASKPGNLIEQDTKIEILQKPPYVSRGGIKLAHALDEFNLDITGLAAIDIGASTGGFTDCLLQSGARRVYAIDVGYGQMDYRLRQDSRVVIMDRTNAHHAFSLPEKVDLASIDVSFISATKIIPNIIEHLSSSANLIILLKPQFEAQRKEVGKGGIIEDPLVHARIIGHFTLWAVDNGFRIRNLIKSPITGADGNQEFLILLRQH